MNPSSSFPPSDSTVVLADDASQLGDIKINHSVVASIVRLAALEVEGTYAIGGSFVDGITELFSKKESDRGVRVHEDEAGNYEIELRVVLRFGVELAKTAVLIQQNVREQVMRMTMKPVGRVDVIIDGVKLDEHRGRDEFHIGDAHHTD
jgi:uncharacterized alkaline shock family protein YloU